MENLIENLKYHLEADLEEELNFKDKYNNLVGKIKDNYEGTVTTESINELIKHINEG